MKRGSGSTNSLPDAASPSALPMGFPFSREFMDQITGGGEATRERKKPRPKKSADVPAATHTSTSTSTSISPSTSATDFSHKLESQVQFYRFGEEKFSIVLLNENDSSSNHNTLFGSGFFDVYLMQGKVKINGFDVPPFKYYHIGCPVWCPNCMIQISYSKKKVEKKRTFLGLIEECADDIKSELLKAMNNNSGDKTLTSLISAYSANATVLLLRHADRSQLPWLESIEDFSQYIPVSDLSTFDNSTSLSLYRFGVGSISLINSKSLPKGSGFNSSPITSSSSPDMNLSIPTSWISAVDEFSSFCSAAAQRIVNNTTQPDLSLPKPNITISETAPARGLICGCKGVGKSTFLRYSINRLLSTGFSRVAVIDLDVGQPEFSPPGMLSLSIISEPILSPPHLHCHEKPALSFFFGDITSKSDPELLASAMHELVSRYSSIEAESRIEFMRSKIARQKEVTKNTSNNKFFGLIDESNDDAKSRPDSWLGSVVPLLVNCDGQVRCLGSEILTAAIQISQSNFIFQIESSKDPDIVSKSASPSIQKIFTLTSCSSTSSRGLYVHAVDLRNLRLMAYFLHNNRLLATCYKKSSSDSNDDSNSNKSRNSLASSDVCIRNGTISDPSGYIALALASKWVIETSFESTAFRTIEPTYCVPPRLTLAVFNAAIVGLHISRCDEASTPTSSAKDPFGPVVLNEVSKESIDVPDSRSTLAHFQMPSSAPSEPPRSFTLDCLDHHQRPPLLPCDGLAITKLIDVDRKVVQLIVPDTAISAISGPFNSTASSGGVSGMRFKFSLYRGNLQIPTIFSLVQGLMKYPYASGETSGEGSNELKARSNMKRKGR